MIPAAAQRRVSHIMASRARQHVVQQKRPQMCCARFCWFAVVKPAKHQDITIPEIKFPKMPTPEELEKNGATVKGVPTKLPRIQVSALFAGRVLTMYWCTTQEALRRHPFTAKMACAMARSVPTPLSSV